MMVVHWVGWTDKKSVDEWVDKMVGLKVELMVGLKALTKAEVLVSW
jgi:hypothetical protein